MRVYRFCNVGRAWIDPPVLHLGPMSYDTDRDRDVVVVDRRGSGLGTILGVIVIAILAVGIWYFAFGPGQGTFSGETGNPDVNVNVELPSAAPEGS